MKKQANRHGLRGNTLFEFAFVAPVLLLLLFGTMDFARVFFTGIAVSSAARAGALYGAQSMAKSTDISGMQTAAVAEAPDVRNLSAVARQWCQCVDGSIVGCSPTACPSRKTMAYVEVTVTAPFQTVAPYPGVPSNLNINSKVTMRAR